MRYVFLESKSGCMLFVLVKFTKNEEVAKHCSIIFECVLGLIR